MVKKMRSSSIRKTTKSLRKPKTTYQMSRPDYLLGLLVFGLTLFGVLMVYNTGVVVAHEQFGDKFWYLKNQSLWALLGFSGAYVVSNIHFSYWQKWAKPFYIISIILLVLVLIPGLSAEVYGARQRLSFPIELPFLGHIGIQPSEIAKFTVVLYLSSWLPSLLGQGKEKSTASPVLATVVPFLGTLGLVLGLVMFQPDLGTALIIGGSAFMVYFLSGVPLISAGVVGVLGSIVATLLAFSSEYRRNRILTFLNPSEDTLSLSYHINQIFIALGSGGLLGVGLGHSRQKYQYLPEVTTDSIFAVIGEEMGFVGASLVIIAFVVIIWRGFEIIKKCDDPFGKLLATGIVSIIAVQAFLNLMTMVALTPITGVPLPFISYGGSSLTMLLIEVGILLNISKQPKVT